LALNTAQKAVLAWIADGSPDGRFEGSGHRVSAAALRSRGLVQIQGRGPTWRAELTARGRTQLERDNQAGRSAEDRDSRKTVRPIVASQRRSAELAERSAGDPVAENSRGSRPSADRVSAASPATGQDTGQASGAPGGAGAAKRTDASSSGDDGGASTPGGAEARSARVEVRVPQRVGRLHPAAREFRDARDRHEVSRDQLGRAVRLIHAMAVEAARRGWSPRAPRTTADASGRVGWSPAKHGHLEFAADGLLVRVRLREDGVRLRGAWEQLVALDRRLPSGWSSYGGRDRASGRYDAEATGRLMLRLDDEQWWRRTGQRANWSDRRTWRLEDKLGEVFEAVAERVAQTRRAEEERRLAAERAAEEARREAQERERAWHEHMRGARLRFREDFHASRLRDQARDWEDARRLAEYCDALGAEHGRDERTRVWLEWARAFVTRLDPLASAPAMAEDPEPGPNELRPYLPAGAHPEGPHHQTPTWLDRGLR